MRETFFSSHNRKTFCSKNCSANAARQRKLEDPEYRRKAALARRLREYDLTEAEYLELMDRQNGCCAGCGTAGELTNPLAIDHDHDTGQVRGVLCRSCNLSVGNAKDNPEVLVALAAYLIKHEVRLVAPGPDQNSGKD